MVWGEVVVGGHKRSAGGGAGLVGGDFGLYLVGVGRTGEGHFRDEGFLRHVGRAGEALGEEDEEEEGEGDNGFFAPEKNPRRKRHPL